MASTARLPVAATPIVTPITAAIAKPVNSRNKVVAT